MEQDRRWRSWDEWLSRHDKRSEPETSAAKLARLERMAGPPPRVESPDGPRKRGHHATRPAKPKADGEDE